MIWSVAQEFYGPVPDIAAGGQRGGDEVHHLRAGRNYGWPLASNGLKYDGTPVPFAQELGISFAPSAVR